MTSLTNNYIHMAGSDENRASDRWLAFDAVAQRYLHMNGIDTTPDITWAWHGYRGQFDQLKAGLNNAKRFRLVKKADRISPVADEISA